jgi:hypothetical protein
MGLKEKIENNIIILLVGAAVAGGSICAGVTAWFAVQRASLQAEEWQSKIDQIEARITSVERRIGGQKFFDIRDMFGPTSKAATAPAGLHVAYYPQGNYSAASQLDGFKYKRTSEGALIAEMYAEEMPPAFLEQANTLAIDAWIGKGLKVGGSSLFKELLPVVFAESLSMEKLNNVTLKLGRVMADMEGASIKEAPDLSNDKELAAFVSKNYDMDAGVQFLAAFLNMAADINGANDSSVQAIVPNIQKVGPVLYFQMIISFSDVKIDNKLYDKYFYVKEVFIINTPRGITLIDTQVPTDNPFAANPYFSRINEWLSYFHVENM